MQLVKSMPSIFFTALVIFQPPGLLALGTDLPLPPPALSPPPLAQLHFQWKSGPQNFQQGALSANADVKALKLVQG